MGIVLDTSVLIAAERRSMDLEDRLEALPEGSPVFITSIVAAELLFGLEKADCEERRARRSAYVEGLLARIPVLPLDLGAARLCARIWATLSTAGKLIGPHDTMIAATAIQHGHSVATCNAAHFKRVPGLDVLDWSLP